MNTVAKIDTETAQPLPIPARKRGRPSRSAKADAGQIDQDHPKTQGRCVDLPKSLDAVSIGHNMPPEALDDEAPAASPPVEVDARFADPLIAEIVQAHRMRRRWTKARNSLILQGKAFGRALVNGEKEAGSALYDQVAAGKCGDFTAVLAITPFVSGTKAFQGQIDQIEKTLVKLTKRLPIAAMTNDIRGFGLGSLASFVGECGSFAAYRSVSALWKRAGLAVIDGERQRKCADVEKAARHGFSPERRAMFWSAADSMARHQRAWLDKVTGEVKKPAGPYGLVLEAAKAKALEKGWVKARAEKHGLRIMTKALLRDLWLASRRLEGKPITKPFSERDPATWVPLAE